MLTIADKVSTNCSKFLFMIFFIYCKGSFHNYVDQILPNCYSLVWQLWTFYLIPTLRHKTKAPFIYYVCTFLGFWDPSPHVNMFLVLKISRNWHFLNPLPPTIAYVIYEWSPSADFILTPFPPLVVHVVIEWPLSS